MNRKLDNVQILFIAEQLDILAQDVELSQRKCNYNCTSVEGLAIALREQLLEGIKKN